MSRTPVRAEQLPSRSPRVASCAVRLRVPAPRQPNPDHRRPRRLPDSHPHSRAHVHARWPSSRRSARRPTSSSTPHWASCCSSTASRSRKSPTPLTVWGWNGSQWHVVARGDAPARVVGGVAFDTDRQTLVVYGGYEPGSNDCNDETWEWDGADWTQQLVDPAHRLRPPQDGLRPDDRPDRALRWPGQRGACERDDVGLGRHQVERADRGWAAQSGPLRLRPRQPELTAISCTAAMTDQGSLAISGPSPTASGSSSTPSTRVPARTSISPTTAMPTACCSSAARRRPPRSPR